MATGKSKGRVKVKEEAQLSKTTQRNLARASRELAKIFEESLRELEGSRLDQFKKKAVFVRWQADSEMNPDKAFGGVLWDLASALRCLPNSPSSVWHERLETLKADAQLHGDSEVLRFTDRMLALVNEREMVFGSRWFEED